MKRLMNAIDAIICLAVLVFGLCVGALVALKLTPRQATVSIAAQVALYSRPLPQHFDGYDIAAVFALKGCASLVSQLCQDDVTCNNSALERCFYP